MSIYFHGIGMFVFLVVFLNMTSALNNQALISLNQIVSILVSSEGKTSNEPTNQTHPQIVCLSTSITLTRLNWTLKISTKRAGRIIPVFQAHLMKSVTT